MPKGTNEHKSPIFEKELRRQSVLQSNKVKRRQTVIKKQENDKRKGAQLNGNMKRY